MPGCQVLVKQPNEWFDPNCFTMNIMGEAGNVPFMSSFGPDFNNVDASYLRACEKPKLWIQGGNDRYGARANIEALFATLPEPKRLVIIEEGDHFFTGQPRSLPHPPRT